MKFERENLKMKSQKTIVETYRGYTIEIKKCTGSGYDYEVKLDGKVVWFNWGQTRGLASSGARLAIHKDFKGV